MTSSAARAVMQRLGRYLAVDWGERRTHLAGRLGTLLCAHSLEMGWLLQKPGTRALALTPRGATAFRDWLGPQRWQHLATAD